MTPAAPRLTIDEENPWPGLSAFDEAAQRFFNGRREESAALRRLVMQAPLTVLFAASGLGKTSLIQAGLFPLLRKDTLPIYVRLDPRESREPLIHQVKAALQSEIRKRRVDAPEFREPESLWGYLHRAGLEIWSEENQLLTPLFVVDQFEEVFTLGAGNAAAVARMRTDLADLIENRMPAGLAARLHENESAGVGLSLDNQRYKILLSFREDFLAQIEGWKREIPSIMRNRLRMLPMSGEQAFEAVNKTAPHLAPELIARRIVSFVAAAGEDSGENTAELEVAPALLSLVCHGLNERRKAQGKEAFDEALLTGTGQAIVADFYRNAVAGVPDRVQRFIERELITERGFRKPCDVDDARTLHGVTDKDLALLVDRRVLRIEPARGTERVELTHDLLTRVVREQREGRRERDRRRRRLMLALAALGAVVVIVAGLYVRFNQQKRVAEEERSRADQQERQARVQTLLAEEAKIERTKAETATTAARTATQAAEREARAAFSHQLAGAAINAQGSATGILFAFNALAVTRDVDHTVLPDAEEALRLTVEAMHKGSAASGMVLKPPGHALPIKRMDFSPDGTRVATSGEEGVKVWDIERQDEILSLPRCTFVEFSRDGKSLACGAPPFGNFVDLETGKNRMRQVGYRSRGTFGGVAEKPFDLRQMGFSPDGKLMLWGSPEVTNLEDGTSPGKPFPGGKAVFSPDGKTLATIIKGTVKLWDIRSGSELHSLDGVADRVVFSGDGNPVAVAPAGAESPVHLWAFSSDRTTSLHVNAPEGGCLALNQNGTLLAFDGFTASSLGRMQLQIVDTSRPGIPILIPISKNPAYSACQFSADGRSLNLQIYRTGETHQTFVWDLSAVDAALIRRATITGASVKIEDPRAGTKVVLPDQDTQRLQAVAFSPDGTRVVASGSDGRARVWDTASGGRLLGLVGEQGIFTAAYSPDGNRIATAGLGPVAKLWDAHTGRFLRDLDGKQDRILAVAFSPDSGRIVAASNGSVKIYDVANGTDVTGAAQKNGTDVMGATFSPDGKRLALVGSEVSIRDAESLNEILRIPGLKESVGSTAMSPDGRILAVGEPLGVHLWRQGSGWKLLPGSTGGGRSSQVVIAFSRDGKRLVTPGIANSIRIWDTESATESAAVYYSDADIQIKGVAFSPDEKQIYAVGSNWALYRFVTPLADLSAEARKLVIDAKVTLSDEDCLKYLHQKICPPQLRRVP